MPHFIVYLKNARYRLLWQKGRDWMVGHVFNHVHDSMDADILDSLESCGFIYLHDDHHDHDLHHGRHFKSFVKSLTIYLFTFKTIFFLCIPPESKWTIYLGNQTAPNVVHLTVSYESLYLYFFLLFANIYVHLHLSQKFYASFPVHFNYEKQYSQFDNFN
jgi:hypothetical protein